jgi:hypothetical protein
LRDSRRNQTEYDRNLGLLTCEERDNLGVIWYENPIR